MMISSQDCMLPMIESQENIDSAVGTLISGLSLCKYEYEEKEKENLLLLDKLGFNIIDLSKNMKQDLKNLFNDNEVLNFERCCQKEHITINAQHLQESLVADNEQMEIDLCIKETDAFFKKIEKMKCYLQRALNSAEGHSDNIDEKSNEKVAKEMIFKGQLEKKEHELKILQKIREDLERPKFSYEEVETLQAEEKKLREEVAILEAKLAKYNGLPLDEKAAAQHLTKLKAELQRVDNEIKMELGD